MYSPLKIEKSDQGKTIYKLTSHRRTLSETDIVHFVNLIGLHEPPFIDMEYVKNEMPGLHNKRFAPAPMLISLGMGLVAAKIMEVLEAMGKRKTWVRSTAWWVLKQKSTTRPLPVTPCTWSWRPLWIAGHPRGRPWWIYSMR